MSATRPTAFRPSLIGVRGSKKNDQRAFELEERACKLGMQGACLVHGMHLMSGLGATKDSEKGRELLRQACAAGESAACKMLGAQ
jgi:TPR repeat protein